MTSEDELFDLLEAWIVGRLAEARGESHSVYRPEASHWMAYGASECAASVARRIGREDIVQRLIAHRSSRGLPGFAVEEPEPEDPIGDMYKAWAGTDPTDVKTWKAYDDD